MSNTRPSDITETRSWIKEQAYVSHPTSQGDIRANSFLRNILKSFGRQTPPPNYDDIRIQEKTGLAIKNGYLSGSTTDPDRLLKGLPPRRPRKLLSAYTFKDLDKYSKYVSHLRNQDLEALDLLDAAGDVSDRSGHEGTMSALQEHLDVGRRSYQCLFTECGNGFFPAESWMRSHLAIAHNVPEQALESYVVECRDVAKRQEYTIQPKVDKVQSSMPSNGSDNKDAPSVISMQQKHEPKKNKSLGLSGSFWGVFQEDEDQETPDRTQLADSGDVESDSIDTDDCSLDIEESLNSSKEYVLSYLMVCVHDMFSLAGSSNSPRHAGTSSSYSLEQTGEPPASGSNNAGRKRGRNESNGEQDGDEDSSDKSRSRKKPQDDSDDADPKKLHKKLACPYYKHDPHKRRSSGACCGPGWDSVHRIKYNYWTTY